MTSKTISTLIHGYSFAASGTSLTITSTGTITGSSDTGSAAVYGGASLPGETILNLGKVGDANYLYGIVLQDGATITNGSATDEVASIAGSQVGIKISGKAGTITNFGSIHADQKGIVLNAGGAVTNGSAADTTALIAIPGYYAVAIDGGVGRVTNFGTIQGQVNLYGGGSVTNQASGTIVDRDAVYIAGGAGTLTNLGKITGVVRVATGQVVNGSASDHTASITGGSGQYGVYLGTGTLTNFGTISGPKEAVSLGTGGVLIAEAGSKLIGPASYGDGVTLVFGAGGGAGTISGLGTGAISGSTTETFKNLQTYRVQAGANWTLSGTNTLKGGDSLTVLGTLSVAGSFSNSGQLAGAGTLAFSAGTATFNAGGTLTVAKVTQSGTSAITVGGVLAYAGVWTQTGGTLSVASGKKLTFSGVGNTLDGALAGAGTVAITGGSDRLAGTKLSVTHLTITGAATTITMAGTITNSGTVTATSGHLLVGPAGATLTGGGSLTLTSAATNEIAAGGAGAVLTNVNNLIQGGGQLGGGTLGLVNEAAGKITGNAAVALVINSGARTVTNAGAITAAAGGGVEVKSAIANTGLLVAAGGVLTLDQAVTGAGSAHINGGTLFAAGAFSENVQFTGTTGTLELAHSQAYSGKITGFSHTGTESLDLRDIGFVSAAEATFSGTKTGGTLTVSDGTHTAKISLVGDYTGVTFKSATDGHGGTKIVDQATAPAAAHFVAAMAAMAAPAGQATPPAQWPPPATMTLAHARD